MMNILIFILLSSEIISVFGKITVIRQQYNTTEMELTCSSEDDGSALVWNNAISEEFLKQSRRMRFYNNESKANKSKLDCKMNEGNPCLQSWIIGNWSITDSFLKHLGPVFDERWEDFTEYGIFDIYIHPVSLKNTTVFSFSTRNELNEMDIAFCNSLDIEEGPCYWIVLGAKNNTFSTIQKCPTGIPLKPKVIDDKCRIIKSSMKHSALSSTKWRTYLIKWDSAIRNLSVYDIDNNIFMQYQDKETTSSTNIYYMFMFSFSPTFYRFHAYSFLHTTVENASLTSPIFQFDNGTICIQLLIGLCAECDINIMLLDNTHNKELKTLTIKGSLKAAMHGLPTWQFVTIEHLTDSNSAIMELRPILNANSFNPLWAVANVRQCPTKALLRTSVIHSTTRNVTCQKLFYNDNTVVSALPDAKANIKLEIPECPEGRIGPDCKFCRYNDHGNPDCKTAAICYSKGCTCSAGYIGTNCTKPCEKDRYGQNCKKKCGFCKSTSTCNVASGACSNGCKTDPKQMYIAPLCQTTIKLEPLIDFIANSRSIKARYFIWQWNDILWKAKHIGYNVLYFYSFIIKGKDHPSSIEKWKFILPNVTVLVENFGNLEPGTTYDVAFGLRHCMRYDICTDLYSEWQTVETRCASSDNFEVEIKEHRLWINTPANKESCLANWYNLTIYNASSGEKISHTSLDKFPYEVLDLPNTTIIINIIHKNETILYKMMRTSEEVPSEVSNVKIEFTSDKEVNLTWKAPKVSLSQQRLWYSVTLRVQAYLGCAWMNSYTLDNSSATYWTDSTKIYIQNLHPYRTYDAEIVTYNSKYSGIPAKITFSTKSSDIASEVFGEINVNGWVMSWEPPKDCKTITGLLYATIEIQGISDAVKTFYTVKHTAYRHLYLDRFSLHGGERYIANLYVIRHLREMKNISAYRTYGFETPPGVPPRVTQLIVSETDDRQNPPVVHLRWKNPRPPLNGTLRIYRIRACDATKCTSTEVQLNAMCNLWDNYICGSIQTYYNNHTIKVVAYNVDVSKPGVSFEVPKAMLDNKIPDQLHDFNVTILNNSVVNLQWRHPRRTGERLKHFHLQLYLISTDYICEEDEILKHRGSPTNIKLPVTNYMQYYSKRLYLLPSTRYIVSIQAVTHADKFNEPMYKEFKTPSTLEFDGQLKYVLYEFSPTISLTIPSVMNNTKDSTMHIIVKGPDDHKLCEGYSKVPENLQAEAGLNVNDIAWQAAELPAKELGGNPFMLGNNLTYGNAKNCPLLPNRMYEITIIIIEHYQNIHSKPIMLKESIYNAVVASAHYNKWLVFIILLFIVPSAAFYFYYRKKKRMLRQNTHTNIPLNECATCEIYDEIRLPHENLDNNFATYVNSFKR